MLLSIDAQCCSPAAGTEAQGFALPAASPQTLAPTSPDPGACWLVSLQQGPGEFPTQGQANPTEGWWHCPFLG